MVFLLEGGLLCSTETKIKRRQILHACADASQQQTVRFPSHYDGNFFPKAYCFIAKYKGLPSYIHLYFYIAKYGSLIS